MVIEQWLSNETKTPKPYVALGSIRDRPNAGGAGDLVRLLHAGRISTVNEGTPYWAVVLQEFLDRWFFISNSVLHVYADVYKGAGAANFREDQRFSSPVRAM